MSLKFRWRGAGFGAVTLLPGAVSSFYVGAALVGVLFPLFR